MTRRILSLDCVGQTYAWGKLGSNSFVAQLKSTANKSWKIDENQTYAELWMGTHVSGPSRVESADGPLLSSWLAEQDSSFVGRVPAGYPTTDLPFLLKVLSVNTALSIQAHPDKDLAVRLHESFPTVYRDANHKPEMLVALSKFEALAGFRQLSEIQSNILNYPEFSQLLTASGFSWMDSEEPKTLLRNLFSSYMSSSNELISEKITALMTRLSTIPHDELNKIDKLMIRLNNEYPNDCGVFAPLILNYMEMNLGDSFFIGANEPHAYLLGDCVECMALSDNVVRAGLTPKFKDTDTLCSMLTYTVGKPTFLKPIVVDSHTEIYRPPYECCAEFELEKITIPVGETANLLNVDCASIVLTIEGMNLLFSHDEEKIEATRGSTILIGSNTDVKITNNGTTSAFLFRAHVNLSK